jgi:ribosomal protein S18 acetylase RimI-like enzyme
LIFLPDDHTYPNRAKIMHIRPFSAGDTDELAGLLEEMQGYYGVFCPPREAIVAGLLNRPLNTEIIVAGTSRVIGFAAFASIFPGPGLVPGLFLKELFVSGSERGQEVGMKLMQRLAAIAVERKFGRVDWTAARTNQRLLKFYDDLGGERKETHIFYRLEGAKLNALAERS